MRIGVGYARSRLDGVYISRELFAERALYIAVDEDRGRLRQTPLRRRMHFEGIIFGVCGR